MKTFLVTVVAIANSIAVVSSSHAIDYQAPMYSITPDGSLSPAEKAGQLEISMAYPEIVNPPNRGSAIVGQPSHAELSGNIYLSWDNNYMNWSAEIFDDTPHYLSGPGNVPHNGNTDVFQPLFSLNDTGAGDGAWWDIVVDTHDLNNIPDIYTRDPELDTTQYADIVANHLAGQKTGTTGYVVEARISWDVLADWAGETYTPTIGDEHGMSFAIISQTPEGLNGFLTDWSGPWGWDARNKMTLVPGQATPTGQEWGADISGNWNVEAYWNDGIVPDGNDQEATFGGVISSPRTVFTETDVTVKSITFHNASQYVVAGNGSLNLESNSGNAALTVAQGSHQLQLAVNLATDSDADISVGQSLEFANRLNLNGHKLTKLGEGELIVSNTLNTGGGTLDVTAGTLSGGGQIGGNLVVNGAVVSPGNGLPSASAVPEPGTFVLLIIGLVGMLCRGRRGS